MTGVRPIGSTRATFILAKLGFRRWMNRLGAVMARRRRRGGKIETRRATPRKSRRSPVVLILVGVLFAVQSFGIAMQFVGRLSHSLKGAVAADRTESSAGEPGGSRVVADEWLWSMVRRAGDKLDLARSERERERVFREFESELEARERLVRRSPSETHEPERDKIVEVFRRRGAEGFQPTEDDEILMVFSESWPEGEAGAAMVRAIGLITLLFWIGLSLLALGSANQDLGQVGWSLEWLFTLPVRARTVFLSRVVEMSLLNVMGWVIFLPFFTVVYWAAGHGAWGIPLGILSALYLIALQASSRVLVETWLRTRLSFARLKNIQAAATLVGLCFWFIAFWAVVPQGSSSGFAELALRFNDGILWTPWTVPALGCVEGGLGIVSFAAVAFLGIALPYAAVRASEYCVRNGLIAKTVARQGKRGALKAKRDVSLATRDRGLRGIAGKDLRLLFRDRNFLIQTLVVPVVIVGFQILLNPTLLEGAAENVRHATVLAFGVGAYVLCFSGFQVLASEGPALWILYTVPQDLSRLLLRKAALWCVFALAYTVAILAIFTIANPSGLLEAIGGGAVAAFGVIVYSFIASGLGVLSTDPLENEPQRRVHPLALQAYIILGALYAYAIYAPSVWPRLVQMLLSVILAAALWQKVRDQLPYLLDPTEAPPPRIALSDGLIAVLVFFVLQGAVALIASASGAVPPGLLITLAFVIAGAITAPGTLLVLWRRRVPRLLASVGLRSSLGSVLRALPMGLVAGALAAGFAFLYIRGFEQFEWFRTAKQMMESPLEIGDESAISLLVLAIVAAPLFEEFIFRGLVYTGLRRSTGPVVAVLGSAALFAMVHPPVSVLPVFGLGVVAAWSFERTRSLVAPIAAHALYNGLVFAMQ